MNLQRKKNLMASVVLLVLGISVTGWICRVKIANRVARHYISKRDMESAKSWLDYGLRIAPSNGESHFLSARVYRREGAYDDAQRSLSRAKQFGWPSELVEREKWLMYAQSGQLAKAEPNLAELLTEPMGDGAEICEAFVIGYIKDHSIEKALQLLTAWQDDFPKDAQPHFLKGVIQQDYGQWNDAIESQKRALSIDETHPEAIFSLAECLIASKKPNDALNCYLRAKQSGNDPARAAAGEAQCLRELGRSREALAILDGLVKQGIASFEGRFTWAQLKSEQGEFEVAASELKELATLQPRNWDVQFAYAAALRGVGEIEAAKELFDEVSHARNQIRKAKNLAEQLKADDVSARFEIGSLHLQFGQPTEGVWWLNSALNYDPLHVDTHTALATYYAKKAIDDPSFGTLANRHRRLAAEAMKSDAK